MRVTMLLCDYAQAADGKLNIIGGGWSLTGPRPTPFGIAVLFQVPWDQANARHSFRLELLDADGQPVSFPGPDDRPQAVAVEGSFETGRPAGLRPGAPLDFPFAMNYGPLPLAPGQRFEWRLTVDGHSEDDWRLAFGTRAP
ncbi:MAG: hypothetical protein ABSG43_10020 [Solirubrobacteraceae bacterium]|jgi:hypothetical protein